MITPVVLMTSAPQLVASTAESVRADVIVHGPV